MEISGGSEKWNSKLFRILNSAMAFSIAYIVLMVGYFFSMAAAAKMYGLSSTVYLYNINFHTEPKDWYKKNVVVIHSAGMIFLLIAAVAGVLLFRFIKKRDNAPRLIFLWMGVIGICTFCAQGMVGALGLSDFNSPYYQNFSVALAWMYVPPIIGFIFAVFLILFMAATAVYLVRKFLILAYSFRKVYKLKNRRKFIFEVAMIPTLIGGMLTTVLIFPDKFIFIHLVQMIYIIVFMIISWYVLFYVDIKYSDVTRGKNIEKLSLLLILLFGAAIYFAAFTLDAGVKV